LNLGHSYIHTVDIESSEEECGETEARETKNEEAKSGKDEVQKEFKGSIQQNIEEKQEKFDKQHNDKTIKHQELDKKTKLEDISQQLYRDIQQKSNKNSLVKIDREILKVKKKVVNKSNDDKQHKLNDDLPNEFNNTVQQKLECGEELVGEVQEMMININDQQKIDNDKEHECSRELTKDSEKENEEIQVQLQIEVPPMPGEEVELYLEVQVDSECFKQLNTKKQHNIEIEHQKAFDKNKKQAVHKDILVVNKNLQIQVDEVNNLQHIEGGIQDKISKGSKQNIEEEDVQSELNKNLQEQFDNKVQQDVEELQQEDDEEAHTNICEETMDENHKRILQDIESLICDLQDKKIKHNINNEEECDDLIALRIAKITKEIEELEIQMDQEHDEELERKYNDEFNRMFSSEVKEKFLEKLLILFNQDAAPYYKRIENLLNIYFPTKLDKISGKVSIDPIHSKFNEDLMERSDVSVDTFEEIQDESDKAIDKFDKVEKASDTNTYTFEEVPEESDIEMKETEDEVLQEEFVKENKDEIQEESDVDVEGFDDEIQDDLKWNLQSESQLYADESDRQSSQESEEEIEVLNEDLNIVTEIVDDYEVELSSVEELSPIEESENEISSTDDEFSSTEIEQCNEKIQHKMDKEEQVKCTSNTRKVEGGVQEKRDNDKPQQFEDLQLQMEIENIQDLEEIPLKLKIQQEQLEEKLHQQMKTFQEEFYKNSKLEYDKEQQLKGTTLNDPVYDRQQKSFYKLKNKFEKTKEEYNDLVQQKMIEALEQEVDEKQLLEMKEFPEEFIEPSIKIEDLHKEVVQLQRECTELEPEFSYNIPLVVEKPSEEVTTNINYNLYEKLFKIHKKKLCFFADCKEWPEKVCKNKIIC